ncbi:MAG: hypothetical protein M3R68_01530, partial [Acidobacteriota bacterium]|nr:hypothetical protein [Acidobacteriota bacterium]
NNDEEMAQPIKGAGFHVAYDGLLILTLSNRVRVLGEPDISKDEIRPNRDPLSGAELQHLARCMAVAGSGTYALRGTRDQQLTRIRTVLLMAKEDGADWVKIYSAIYAILGKANPHFPTEQEMRRQVEAAFHQFTHRDR